ncbi:hypothetical protein P8935_20185 [Telmatobacter sp. DSM 110680]|uniref:Uncharacterized protein n=1 Tax=Telmatobacter sp. DSM 110680 TaxID=3036704 RepID=A0AAU7DHS7_9BACT
MQQLSNLSGWPPQGGAGAFDTRKESFVKTPESVTFRKVDRIVGTRVDLTCLFGKEVVTFRFFASNRGTAENVAEVLGRSGGQTLRDLGMLYIADNDNG